MFASSVSKAARSATESAVKYGGIATQKVSEMASTVTDKVNLFNSMVLYYYDKL